MNFSPQAQAHAHITSTDGRKIVANRRGIVNALGLTGLCLLGVVLGSIQAYDYWSGKPSRMSSIFEFFGIMRYDNFKIELKPWCMSALMAFVVLSLAQMYVPLRALCQPSFTAGAPSKNVK